MSSKATTGKTDTWFKDTIIYELHVRSFLDGNGDGIGDLIGLSAKLDYLEDLGITTIWLLPFYDSPLRDDGYDVSDYFDVHPDYGNLEIFRKFLKKAHKKGIRVITELCLNHTSDQHEWFQKARKAAPDSRDRNYYVWSDTPDKYAGTRIIMSDTEASNWTWDDEAGAYYWHRFYSHQPDLNYDSPDVQKEIMRIVDFWMGMGVDGLRLSSVAFLFEREGTSNENLPETHEFLRKLRKHVDKKFPGRILMAEVNMWPEIAATYFGEGDECQMSYYFPLMPRLFIALDTEDAYPVIDIFEQTPVPPENCQWALFLRNHDEIALEMVTDEEKDYLWKAYGEDPNAHLNKGIRRRLAPMLQNDRRKIELLNILLFSLPGTPIIYYGDEIGMGDNIYLGDRAGVRTPMQWNSGLNAGFSDANPQKLFLPVISDPIYRSEAVNVANQESNPASYYWWIKQLIGLRKRYKVFGNGDLLFVESSNNKVLAFTREFQNQTALVIANLSRYSQATHLKLISFAGREPVEIFSQNKFPTLGEDFFVTLGPYGYYWFILEEGVEVSEESERPVISFGESWEEVVWDDMLLKNFETRILEDYMKKCRWFGGKARKIADIKVEKKIPYPYDEKNAILLIIKVAYNEGPFERYLLPLSFVSEVDISYYRDNFPTSIIVEAVGDSGPGFLVDAIYRRDLQDHIFFSMFQKYQVESGGGELNLYPGKTFSAQKIYKEEVKSEILRVEQSNTSVIYNDNYFFKMYRKLEDEINPDLEVVRFLTERTSFENSPEFAGGMEFQLENDKSIVLGLLQKKVENQGDAWSMTLDSLDRYYDHVIMNFGRNEEPPPLIEKEVMDFESVPTELQGMISTIYADRIKLLGQRTAQMHKALASSKGGEAFKPEPFDTYYLRAMYSGYRKLAKERLKLLSDSRKRLNRSNKSLAKEIMQSEKLILDCFSEVYKNPIKGSKIRIHGDYHLGQVLFDGQDFVIIDFEGEPGIPFSERRIKRSALKDVAGMIRSLHYAAFGQLMLNDKYSRADLKYLEKWALQWYHYMSRVYLNSYLETAGKSVFIPNKVNVLLRTYMLEKAVYELGYELNSRPDWVGIPLKGISYILERYSESK